MNAAKEIKVFWSPLSQRFYASQHWRLQGGLAVITGKKFDVTQDIARAITEHEITFKEKNRRK